MNSVSESEMFRRLKLVRDIRVNYVNKYELTTQETKFHYPLLNNLDNAEWIKVIEKDCCSRIKYGKHEEELGSIYNVSYLMEEICTDEKIIEMEKDYFKNTILKFLKYSLKSDLSFEQRRLSNIQAKVDKMTQRLKELEVIVVD